MLADAGPGNGCGGEQAFPCVILDLTWRRKIISRVPRLVDLIVRRPIPCNPYPPTPYVCKHANLFFFFWKHLQSLGVHGCDVVDWDGTRSSGLSHY